MTDDAHPLDRLDARVTELEAWARGTPPPVTLPAPVVEPVPVHVPQALPVPDVFDQDQRELPASTLLDRDPLWLVPLALAVVAVVLSLVAIVLAAVAL